MVSKFTTKMSLKKNAGVSQKVQEIKHMQNNWMKQRAASADDTKSTVETKQRHNRKGNISAMGRTSSNPDKDTISWVIGGAQKKRSTASISLRSRSASPARNSSSKHEKQKATPRSQPTSARVTSRSNPTSSRSHKDSRPPSGISGKVSHENKNITSERVIRKERSLQSNRSLSETDLRQAFQKVKKDHIPRLTGDRRDHDTPSVPPGHSEMCNGDIGQSEHGLTGLLQPSKVDNLAEQLSQRVKNQILEEQNAALLKLGIKWQDSILETKSDSGGHPTAHSCNKCKQLMVPPDHTPVLLVPCGHTLCEPCAEDRIKCPVCRAKVSSIAVNESLRELILKSAGKAKGSTSSGSQSSRADDSNQSQESDYADGLESKRKEAVGRCGGENRIVSHHQDGDFRSTFAPLTRRTDMSLQLERYEEEFESLSIRCEAYEHEEEDILNRVQRKNEEIDKQKKQISNIDQQQEKIKEEIASLQEKSSILKTHQEEFQMHCAALEEIKDNDLEQLKSIKETKKGLQKQREKIKFLARNVGLDLIERV